MTQEGKTMTIRFSNLWKISTIVLTVIILAFLITGFRPTGRIIETSVGSVLTPEQAANKAIEYVNTYLLQGQGTATLVSVKEENGLYNAKLNIGGREYDSYITMDGKLFFPSAIDLTETPETPQPTQQPSQDIPKTETPNVKLFTMSFCPYGNQAEEAMHPVVEALGNVVEVEPHYVIYSNYRGGGPQYCLDEENKYCSMHGIQELNQDVRELCVYKYQRDKYWDFVLKINEQCSSQNVDSCWEAIAEEKGIDTEKIKTCQKDEALDLLAKEVELNEKYGVRGSPTLIINDVIYSGGRTPEAYKQAICSGFVTEPDECSKTLSGSASSSPTGGCA